MSRPVWIRLFLRVALLFPAGLVFFSLASGGALSMFLALAAATLAYLGAMALLTKLVFGRVEF